MDFKCSHVAASAYSFLLLSMYNCSRQLLVNCFLGVGSHCLNVFTNVIELRGPMSIFEIAIIATMTTIIFHLFEDEAAAGESDLSSIARNSSRLMRLSPVVSHVLKMRSACSLLTFFIIWKVENLNDRERVNSFQWGWIFPSTFPNSVTIKSWKQNAFTTTI